MLGGVAGANELLSKPFSIPLSLVSLEYDVALSVDKLRQVYPIDCVSPLVEEVFDSVLADMSKSSLEESFLEVLVLCSILEAVKGTLQSPLKEPIENLCHASCSMSLRLMLSLSNRLASVMPVLESLGHIQVFDPLSDLNKLPGELSVVNKTLSDGFEASPHDSAVPFLGQLGRPLSHVDGDLGPLKPLPH